MILWEEGGMKATPERIAEVAMSTPEGRSAIARIVVSMRNGHGQQPVAPAVVARIRELRAQGMTITAIAALSGVSQRTVARYTRIG